MVADDAATPGVLPDGRLELGMGAGRLALDDAAGSAEALIWNIGRVC
jgi:alkanesulfonate monooxygenase SsuD/methylene tetrahydromethanopterin reductase-like flavin-dependent oxidoreductase (luciferase family)